MKFILPNTASKRRYKNAEKNARIILNSGPASAVKAKSRFGFLKFLGFIGIGLFASFIDVYAVRVVLSWISISARFDNFARGIFDIGAVIYLCSLTFLFLFLTVRVYEKRRWS